MLLKSSLGSTALVAVLVALVNIHTAWASRLSSKRQIVREFERFVYPSSTLEHFANYDDDSKVKAVHKTPLKAEFKEWLHGSLPKEVAGFHQTIVKRSSKQQTAKRATQEVSGNDQCSNINDNLRFDCHPEQNATKSKCEARGCCWAVPKQPGLKYDKYSLGVPSCFYPTNYPSYSVYNTSHDGKTVFLKRSSPSYYPKDIMLLRMDITTTDNGANIKIYDPLNKRYEVPIPYPGHHTYQQSENSALDVVVEAPFNVKIIKKTTGVTLFDMSAAPLIYTDQLIQFSSPLPGKYLYGLGERRDSFLRSLNWQRFTMFATDQSPRDNSNLYGSHPFFLTMLPNGEAKGAFLLNSNAMEVILQPTPAITYRLLGGIIDWYIFDGPSPADVVKQYTEFIGRPPLPPYWGLGFHLCRYNYGSANKTRMVWQRTRAANIPFDVQWNDIDYMDRHRDFTYDPKNFKELPQLVKDIHTAGMHYIPIIDPGLDIPDNKSGPYPPYDEAVKQDILIKDSEGNIFRGKVWSDHETVYPDFTNPKTQSFWSDQFTNYYQKIPFDGAWIDMNEPSNFYDGTKTGCPNSPYENPPYVPELNGGKLAHKTVCMTAKQNASIHYNVHNLYGITETIATNVALKTLRNKRPFIISRSTFPGQGHYGGHWSGDIYSTWDDMQKSIPAILDFSLFGIPLMGADICGFVSNTTVKLCQRWMELGAFYPFSRNHNTAGTIDQDPVALGADVVQASVKALSMRYLLLPHLYTQFYKAAQFGETVARPVFFEFPNDVNTYGIDTQFLWGPSVMILPALKPDVTVVEAYFPAGTWYFLNSFEAIHSKGELFEVGTPLDAINVALRAGHIIPVQTIAQTTTQSRKNNFGLLVALDDKGTAVGELYWDDGDSLGTLDNGTYNLLNFMAKQNQVTSTVIEHGAPEETMPLGFLMAIGVPKKPTKVLANKKSCRFGYDKDLQVLIAYMNIPMASNNITISWS